MLEVSNPQSQRKIDSFFPCAIFFHVFINFFFKAAPGGISLELSKMCPDGIVFAVDPAELTIEQMPKNIIHLRMKVQDAMPQLQEKSPFDFIVTNILSFHLLLSKKKFQKVCDVNCTADTVFPMFDQLVPMLREGASLLWTIKMAKRFRSKSQTGPSASHERFVKNCERGGNFSNKFCVHSSEERGNIKLLFCFKFNIFFFSFDERFAAKVVKQFVERFPFMSEPITFWCLSNKNERMLYSTRKSNALTTTTATSSQDKSENTK